MQTSPVTSHRIDKLQPESFSIIASHLDHVLQLIQTQRIPIFRISCIDRSQADSLFDLLVRTSNYQDNKDQPSLPGLLSPQTGAAPCLRIVDFFYPNDVGPVHEIIIGL